ncbi:MAG: hypothetical protein ACI9YH_001762 [Colwellia sp.]|jgi:hypothetical protein
MQLKLPTSLMDMLMNYSRENAMSSDKAIRVLLTKILTEDTSENGENRNAECCNT